MKDFIKYNWFKLIIVFILLIFSLIAFLFYTQKQKEFKTCVENAQVKREKYNSEVTKAWVKNRVLREWTDQAYKDIKEIYNDDIKDCLLIK